MPEENQNASSQQGDKEQGSNSSAGKSESGGGQQGGSQDGGGQPDGEGTKKPKRPMEPRRKARLFFSGSLLFILLLTLVLLFLWHTSGYETTDDAQVDGHLNSVASRVQGTVIGVYAEDNEPVKAGQLLVKLDPTDLQTTANKSRASYEQAVAQLAMDFPNVPVQQNTNKGTIDQDTASVMNAQASLEGSQKDLNSKVATLRKDEAANEKAQKDLVRYRELMEKREIAPSDYDQYLATAQQNQATVDSDRYNVESAQKTIDERRAQLFQQQARQRQDIANAAPQTAMRRSQLDSDKANIAAAKAQLDSDQLNVSYTTIYSPVDGIATQRNAELGGRVNAAQQVMVVVQTGNQFVTANYKETQLKKMRRGQKVDIKVDALDRTFSGAVDHMPAATGDRNSLFPPENATGNYVKVVQRLPVRIIFDPNQKDVERVRPGMSVETKVHF